MDNNYMLIVFDLRKGAGKVKENKMKQGYCWTACT